MLFPDLEIPTIRLILENTTNYSGRKKNPKTNEDGHSNRLGFLFSPGHSVTIFILIIFDPVELFFPKNVVGWQSFGGGCRPVLSL